MKFSAIRVIYIIFSLSIVFCSYKYSNTFINTSSKALDVLSYIGTVATIIGLIITICEVIHNVQVSKSIKIEAEVIFSRIKSIENASTISECLAALDDVNNAILSNDFKLALKVYQFFRKLCVKVGVSLTSDSDDKKIDLLGAMEQSIMSASHSSPSSPLTPAQKNKLTNQLLKIKKRIENANPANGGNNAAT